MSSVNYMEKLLAGIRVEWKAMREIGNFVRGNGLQKSDFKERGIGCIHYGQIYTYYNTFAYKTKSFVSQTLATKLRKAQKGDLIIATTSENIEDVCKPLVWLGEDEVCVSGETYIFKHNQNSKYLAYYLQTPMFFDFKKQNRTGTKVVRVHGDKLAEFQIPIPPLDIQSEIVRILDNFTKLTAELTAELHARKKQYTYYRDKLLTFEDGEVEWKTLGKLAENLDAMRKPVTSSLREAGNIPYYGASGIVDYVKDYIFNGDYLLISEDGANLLARSTPIAFSVSGKSWVNNHAHILKFNTYAERRFVEYYLNSIDLTPYISGAAQPKLNQKNLNGIQIPNPALAEKEKIVSILDKFDALTTSLTEGLPREIKLRQKQYEYYRNLLLTFPQQEA